MCESMADCFQLLSRYSRYTGSDISVFRFVSHRNANILQKNLVVIPANYRNKSENHKLSVSNVCCTFILCRLQKQRPDFLQNVCILVKHRAVQTYAEPGFVDRSNFKVLLCFIRRT
jgi:hypothetical protein